MSNLRALVLLCLETRVGDYWKLLEIALADRDLLS